MIEWFAGIFLVVVLGIGVGSAVKFGRCSKYKVERMQSYYRRVAVVVNDLLVRGIELSESCSELVVLAEELKEAEKSLKEGEWQELEERLLNLIDNAQKISNQLKPLNNRPKST